jgi:hypothetical protein
MKTVVEVRSYNTLWDVVVEDSDTRLRYYRIKHKRDHPDALSTYLSVTNELDQEKEQTNGACT